MYRLIYIILYALVVIISGCYTVSNITTTDDPIILLERKYAVRLDASLKSSHAQEILTILDSTISIDYKIPTSIWKMSRDDIKDDIKLMHLNDVVFVTLNKKMFSTDTKEQNKIQKRLYFAIVDFLTNKGTDRLAIEQILKARYGIVVDIHSYISLTQNSTKETSEDYSDFDNKDLMIFISILEEFPTVWRRIPELRYIIQRIDDEVRAPGLAWTSEGYIELSASLFKRNFDNDVRRLLAHEKAHFLWEFYFTEQTKEDWINLSGWYEDLPSETGWKNTSKRSEFVSDYAYEKNPNEDMAETFGYYLVFPDVLRSVSLEKYEFIEKQIIEKYTTRLNPELLN
ncbi:hypothetical protein C6497_16250 [Candidatus Poribacteria bacterium]|nr:MAG: hypothetical protein C6497_16250 [Candidatus Poribacteria bacterium]